MWVCEYYITPEARGGKISYDSAYEYHYLYLLCPLIKYYDCIKIQRILNRILLFERVALISNKSRHFLPK